jgi:NTE family protein
LWDKLAHSAVGETATLLGSSVNLVGLFELGKTYKLPSGPKTPNLPLDFAGGLIIDTIFGPVEVAGAVGD